MRRVVAILLCALCMSTMSFAKDKKNTKETVTFLVESMECDHCIKTIEGNIAFEKGVTDLKCDLKKHTVEVTFKNTKTDVQKLIKAFEKIRKPAVVYQSEK